MKLAVQYARLEAVAIGGWEGTDGTEGAKGAEVSLLFTSVPSVPSAPSVPFRGFINASSSLVQDLP